MPNGVLWPWQQQRLIRPTAYDVAAVTAASMSLLARKSCGAAYFIFNVMSTGVVAQLTYVMVAWPRNSVSTPASWQCRSSCGSASSRARAQRVMA